MDWKKPVISAVVYCVFAVFGLIGFADFASAENGPCLECHDSHETVVGIFHEKQPVTCTGCHGNSQEHLDRSRNPPSVTFNATSDRLSGNRVCLACHDNENRTHWQSSAHASAELGCNDCHQVHEKQDPVLAEATSNQVCATCHQDVAAKFKLPSTHPLNTSSLKHDLMQCTGCHASHGSSSDAMLAASTSVETCVECHHDKRGPFLFEHEPVAEDCGLCHKPHGSVVPSLLNARQPFMCQQCHLAANHPSRLADGTALSIGDSNLLIKGCTSCHSQVHGSNHPSGSKLTR